MATQKEALAEYKTLLANLDKKLESLKKPERYRPKPGEDPRASLLPLAEMVNHDSSKFAMMFGKDVPKPDDSIGLAKFVWKNVDQFSAWCCAVQSESPVMKREVEVAATSMLTGMRNIIKFIVDNKMQKAVGPQLVGEACGQVMMGNEKLKKLSKTEASGVQKEVLQSAAAVKTVVSDVKDMLSNSAAHAMEDLGLEEG
eukprot:CAMPEP_0181313470 /NCGR_PEP_ID=MMETSP1101-20121128/14263_1 /TAXON_ID=46948 /ORGANISM="Rhodomonas abbreviata, Strain Caron Lab Isolate" /LENGTH=198 /DNA_ID=CAMNT_0023420421 /DNA_START=179 /DNA_END=771 /DNA_ORIENTATION=+